jgi:pyruvate dehydrogenase E1 component alpha subunit
MLEDYMQNKDPVKRLEERLLSERVIDDAGVEGIQQRIEREFNEGYEFAQASPFPVADDVTRGVFADDEYWRSEPSRDGGTG